MKVGEVFIEMLVKGGDNAEKVLGDIRKNLIQIQIAAASAVFGINKFVEGTISRVADLSSFNQQTGLSINLLREWQQAAQMSNLKIGADQVTNSIINLQKNLAQIKLGGGNMAPFQMLGIDISGNAFSVLNQLRGAIKNIKPEHATNLIQQMGLSPEMLSVLRLSNDEFKKLSENRFLSKEQSNDVTNLGLQIRQLKLHLVALKDQAVAKLAPALEELIKGFFIWLKNNGESVISAISHIVSMMGKFLEIVGYVTGYIAKMIGNITGVDNGLKVLTATVAVLMLSFFPVFRTFSAIIVLLQDFAVYMRGGQSAIGDFINAFKNFKGLESLKTILGGAAILAFLANFSGAIKVASLTIRGLAMSLGFLSKNPLMVGLTALGASIPFFTGEKTEKTENAKSLSMQSLFGNIFSKKSNDSSSKEKEIHIIIS